MKIIPRILVSALLAAGLAMPLAAADPKPLFAEDTPLKLTITAPFGDIVSGAKRNTDPHPALIARTGTAERHAIQLSARGKSRRQRDACRFPPLRVDFDGKPDAPSVFAGQNRLKLVTHCRDSDRYQQHALLEYAAYRLYAALTLESLNVRLADIAYIDAESGKTIAERTGFFIEDTDHAARRLDIKELDISPPSVGALDNGAAGRIAVFQYMIGNLDWSMVDATAGAHCCHNMKVIGAEDSTTGLIPVPYDFDQAGLVDAPYAAVAPSLGSQDVTLRRYRGFCRHNHAALETARDLRGRQAELTTLAMNISGLSDRTKKKLDRFLAAFFADIATDSDTEKKLLKKCR